MTAEDRFWTAWSVLMALFLVWTLVRWVRLEIAWYRFRKGR